MEKHVHKYQCFKVGKKGYLVYRCMHPGCPHYLRREFMVGRISICWRCDQPFIINQRNLAQKKVHCFPCTRKKVGIIGEHKGLPTGKGNELSV